MSCEGIISGALASCTNPLVPFVRQRLLIGNLQDIDVITRSVTPGEENVIEDITMKVTKQMFAFEGLKSSISAQSELVPDGFTSLYNHQCNLIVFDVSSEQKLNLQAMASVEQFAIVENSKDDSLDNSIFEVFGIGRGMLPSELIRINADIDTGAGYSIVLITPDIGGKEVTLPDSFFDTDLSVTEANIEALLIPAV